MVQIPPMKSRSTTATLKPSCAGAIAVDVAAGAGTDMMMSKEVSGISGSRRCFAANLSGRPRRHNAGRAVEQCQISGRASAGYVTATLAGSRGARSPMSQEVIKHE